MTHQTRPPALPTDLTGRVVFVAGGGSAGPGWSIGRAACVTYARQGARVCVWPTATRPRPRRPPP